jgi:hypothetical protein
MPWLHSMKGTKLYGPITPGLAQVTGQPRQLENCTAP